MLKVVIKTAGFKGVSFRTYKKYFKKYLLPYFVNKVYNPSVEDPWFTYISGPKGDFYVYDIKLKKAHDGGVYQKYYVRNV